MRTLLTALILLVASAAQAGDEEIVSPSEFRDYAEGWTLYFERDGQHFGSEEFREDGRVRWRYRDGTCVEGAWRSHGAQLCFLYDSANSDGSVQCWRVLRQDDDLIVRLLDGPNAQNPGLELRVSGRDKKPLLCGDPGTRT
ncbi:MAG: hypothetical protein AAFV19_10620 [Pseudomonadota bacterium]